MRRVREAMQTTMLELTYQLSVAFLPFLALPSLRQNMSDRIAYRNRGTLPKRSTISLIRSWERSSQPCNTIRAMLLTGLMSDANDIVGNITIRGAEIDRIVTGHTLRAKNTGRRENLTLSLIMVAAARITPRRNVATISMSC